MAQAKRCENCEWWQDYEDRFWGRISDTWGPRGRGIIELRACKHSPDPKVETVGHKVYTDKEFICDSYRKAK